MSKTAEIQFLASWTSSNILDKCTCLCIIWEDVRIDTYIEKQKDCIKNCTEWSELTFCKIELKFFILLYFIFIKVLAQIMCCCWMYGVFHLCLQLSIFTILLIVKYFNDKFFDVLS